MRSTQKSLEKDVRQKMVNKKATAERDLLAPVTQVQVVEHSALRANDYNPNVVNKQNLKLLTQSILSNGWTLPIVVRPDMTIIDGFHRWTVAGQEPLRTRLGGKVPVVVVEHSEKAGDVYGTITHNRARGTHLLEPMKAIVKDLMESGKSVKEIAKETGMRDEEIFRLGNFSREEFLERMLARSEDYSPATYHVGS